MSIQTRLAVAFPLVLLLAALRPIASPGQEPAVAAPEITVEWVYGPERFAISRVPSTRWLADGRALMEAADGRGLLHLDPETGKASPAVDLGKALTALRGILGRAPDGLALPESLDAAGRRGVYTFDGDVFVLDFADASWTEVTKTAEPELAPRISRDGTKVAFVRLNDLHVHDLEAGTTLRLTRDGGPTMLNGTASWVYWEEIFGREDLAHWWSPDGSRLAFIQFDESAVDEVVFKHFVPAVPQVLKQRYPKAGHVNPGVRVGLVEPKKDAEVVWAELGEPAPEYVVRVHWLPGGERVAVLGLNRAQNELTIHLVDAATGKAEVLLTEKDEHWVNVHDDLWFLENGKHLVWASERDGFGHLYRFDMEGGLVNRITGGPWSIRGTSGVFWGRKAVQAIDEETGWVYFTGLKDGSTESNLYRVKLEGGAVERLTPESGTHGVSVREDGRYFFDEFSSATTPPSLTLRRGSGEIATAITEPRWDLVKPLDLALPELFHVPARDGFLMPAYLYKPKDFDPARKYPVILHVYGGPAAPSVANAWDADVYFNQILLRDGFLVACIDNRSATAISKRTEDTIAGQMYGDGELGDLLDGVKWLKAQPWVDPARVGIWGWSGGGSFTLLAMTRSREFKAGISVAPVTRWEYYDTIWGEKIMKRPQDNPEGYAHCDLTRTAKDLHGRLMLVHGTYDDNVHAQNTWHFVHELVRANKLFDLMIYPMRQHGISDRAARIHLYSTMADFWRRHL